MAQLKIKEIIVVNPVYIPVSYSPVQYRTVQTATVGKLHYDKSMLGQSPYWITGVRVIPA